MTACSVNPLISFCPCDWWLVNYDLLQTTPLYPTSNMKRLHQAGVYSSTPKTNRFDPTATPEPEASPVLSKNSYPHSYTNPCESVENVDPVRRLETSLGEVLAPGGNLMNVTYVSPSVTSHQTENSSIGSNVERHNRLPVAENLRQLASENMTGSPGWMYRVCWSYFLNYHFTISF